MAVNETNQMGASMVSRISFPVFFLIAAAGMLQAAPPDGSGYSWKLIFKDEFEGTSLDRTKWILSLIHI